jgi:hypothetical protein
MDYIFGIHKMFVPTRLFNIQFINFDDFIIVNREKLATRATEQLYVEYLKTNFELHKDTIRMFRPYTSSFSMIDLFRYYLHTDYRNQIDSTNVRYINDSYNLYRAVVPEYTEVMQYLKLSDKLSKISFNKTIETFSNIANQTDESVNQILNKSFDKPIIFLYKNPMQYALTSIIQDMEMFDFKDTKNSIKKIKEILTHHGSIGLHRTPWTSIIFPIIEGNKNIVLVNLDSTEITWNPLFKKFSNGKVDIKIDYQLHEENEILNSNKKIISQLKPILEQDEEINDRIRSIYASDFLLYEYLKNDIRNYNLDI